ncbi:hypothetical protein fugu_008079 [Takifugu bimaculatus]|uniref:BEACH-type PH domain-containing protein n=1 Tax=Takifugu bimaculatus TaxID=433685 RepID=A0A4Z2B2K1_9TELE|nr:hypothetical protein fugu_008079 [Takifugu bimaculatus]
MELLKNSVAMQEQVLACKGFLVIGHTLEKSSKVHVTRSVLDIVLAFSRYLSNLQNGIMLLKQLCDHILFNPAIWIHAPAKVQLTLYTYLATEFIGSVTIYNTIRRVSTVLQVMHTLKFYYWVVNPQDRSGVLPKGLDGPRPNQKEILSLRAFLLLFVKQLIMKDHGVKDDELQSILNYLLTMHEDDNLMDVLQLLVALMSEHPGSMIQAFDQRNGIRVIFKLLASKSEGIRVQALKVMGYFLKHMPAKRKSEVMLSFGLFSLLTERLMLHNSQCTMTTYNVLFEILTEQICTQVIHKQHPDPDSTVKILNPQILKVIAILLKNSAQSPETMEVRRVFLSDMIKLFNNSKENRSEEQKITEMVYAVFRILLYHAIKYEWGGWRVWVDTLSITHSKVTFEQHKENLSRMFRQYQRQESAGSVRTISGASQSMETMESVSSSPAEESAPSTVIELTVDSPSSPTGASSPTEPSDEAKPASVTVSNILEGAGDYEQKLDENNEPTVTQEKEEQIKEPKGSTEERRDHPQTPVRDGEVTEDSGAVKMADVSTTEVPVTDKRDESEPSNSEPNSMNEADIEAPPSSEQEGRSEMSSEATPCLENSMLGGASVFNEDLVDVSSVSDQVQPSDNDDSQEESSDVTGPAGEEEPVKEEEAQNEHDVGEEVKDEKVGTDGNTEGTTPAGVTETSKDEETLEQSCTTPATQTSETTTPPAVQEVEPTSASDSDKQPSEVAAEEPTTSAHVDSSTAASSSGKTKEIKIARLDVSNVASDTERLELKETETNQTAGGGGGTSGPRRDGSMSGPRSTMFRIPEFRWSHMHQRLLTDLLFSVETEIQMWRSHSTKTILDFVNSSENVVFVHNSIHLISQVVDNLIMACGGILPLLSAATSSTHELENIEPSQGLTVEASVTFLQRLINLVDVLIFASSLNFTEIEAEKNMSSGGVLRQCLRLVCAMAVRNCLECQASPVQAGQRWDSTHLHSSARKCTRNIQICIRTGESGTISISSFQHKHIHFLSPVDAVTGGMSPVRDLDRLLQDMDINRLRAVVFRDIEDSKQAQFLALAVVYFISVLMVSKYRDILEPHNDKKHPQRSQSARSTDSSTISGEVENGVSIRRYDSGIGDDHTFNRRQRRRSVIHRPLSTLSSEVRPSLPADSKGKNVKDILRSLVSPPSDDVTVDPNLLPPSFLGSMGDRTRESFRSFDRSVIVAPKKSALAPSISASPAAPAATATAASVSSGTPMDSVAVVSSGDAAQSTSAEAAACISERLEHALEKAAPLLREIFVDFAPFLSRTLLGSHGQELLIEGTSLVCMKSSSSVVELVMLLCSQEWQNSIQKNAGLAFIELVNEGRLLSHTMKDHLVRVANEAEFILSRQRTEDIHKHAEFESACAQYTADKRDEERMCDHLIRAAKYRDHVTAMQLIQKIVNILTDKHGAWGSSPTSRPREFWRLDYWEDDLRRRRRFIRNPFGSTHSEATLKAAADHVSEEDILRGKQPIRGQALAHQNSESETLLDGDDDTLSSLDEKDLDNVTGPVNLSTNAQLVAPAAVLKGTLSVTASELYFEVDEDDPGFKAIDPKILAYTEGLHGKWLFTEIRAIFSRRYLLQNTAVEIFMANRMAVMFNFPDAATVKKVVHSLPRVGVGTNFGLPQTRRISLATPKQLFKAANMTQRWQRREITNFEYLIFVNTIAALGSRRTKGAIGGRRSSRMRVEEPERSFAAPVCLFSLELSISGKMEVGGAAASLDYICFIHVVDSHVILVRLHWSMANCCLGKGHCSAAEPPPPSSASCGRFFFSADVNIS